MNNFVFCGLITRDAELRSDIGMGQSCNFHVSIGMGGRRPDVWAQVTLCGKRAAEQLPDLWAGQIVTVEGIVEGTNGGPIHVRARNVVPHNIDEDETETEHETATRLQLSDGPCS